jgi:hypothetical protein
MAKKKKQSNKGIPRWTREEVRLLRELYPETPMRELIRRIERSEDAIRAKAGELGLNSKKIWSEEDIKRLKKLYHDTPAKEIARLLTVYKLSRI